MNNLAPMKNCPGGARLPKLDAGVHGLVEKYETKTSYSLPSGGLVKNTVDSDAEHTLIHVSLLILFVYTFIQSVVKVKLQQTTLSATSLRYSERLMVIDPQI